MTCQTFAKMFRLVLHYNGVATVHCPGFLVLCCDMVETEADHGGKLKPSEASIRIFGKIRAGGLLFRGVKMARWGVNHSAVAFIATYTLFP